MTINPNDLDAIKSAIKEAIPKERVRKRQRTPNPAENNNGKYPMRNVQEFPGGHRITMDSTPGHRVMERYHGSGTVEQWAEDGSETKIVVGNAHEHIKEGYTLTVDQNGDIRIEGHARVSVGGGVHLEIAGDVTMYCGGNFSQYVAKNYNLMVTGDVNISTQGNMNTTVNGERTTAIGKNDAKNVGLRQIDKVGSDKLTDVGGNMSTAVKGKSAENSTGNMVKNAPRIDLNPGGGPPPPPPKVEPVTEPDEPWPWIYVFGA